MNIKTGTITRTILLLIALANQVLAIFGREKLPFLEEDIYQLISISTTIWAAAIAWWKNNSFTKPAIEADKFLEKVRDKDNG